MTLLDCFFYKVCSSYLLGRSNVISTYFSSRKRHKNVHFLWFRINFISPISFFFFLMWAQVINQFLFACWVRIARVLRHFVCVWQGHHFSFLAWVSNCYHLGLRLVLFSRRFGKKLDARLRRMSGLDRSLRVFRQTTRLYKTDRRLFASEISQKKKEYNSTFRRITETARLSHWHSIEYQYKTNFLEETRFINLFIYFNKFQPPKVCTKSFAFPKWPQTYQL